MIVRAGFVSGVPEIRAVQEMCVCLGPGGARHFRAKTRKQARKRENAHGSTRTRKLDSYDHLRI